MFNAEIVIWNLELRDLLSSKISSLKPLGCNFNHASIFG